MPKKMATSPDDLAPRQRVVLAMMATGKPDAAIAAELGITTNTVRKHLGAVYRRLRLEGVGNPRVGAVMWYLRHQRCVDRRP